MAQMRANDGRRRGKVKEIVSGGGGGVPALRLGRDDFKQKLLARLEMFWVPPLFDA
jgi:hypothetical protein